MTVTIDKAGRIVIPANVRLRLGLRAGTPIELTVEDASIRLMPAAAAPRLVERRGRLVARPALPPRDRPALDVAALIEEERNRWP